MKRAMCDSMVELWEQSSEVVQMDTTPPTQPCPGTVPLSLNQRDTVGLGDLETQPPPIPPQITMDIDENNHIITEGISVTTEQEVG